VRGVNAYPQIFSHPTAKLEIPGDPIPWSAGSKVRPGDPKSPRKVPDKQAKRASDIAEAASRAYPDLWLPKGQPVRVVGHFFVCRPRTTHYGSGANHKTLKDTAPKAPTGKPDLSNLLKLIEDALTGIFWHDDDQVTELGGWKRYVHWWERPRSEIQVTPL
jgi:Endodeoxyribonuclease RusA